MREAIASASPQQPQSLRGTNDFSETRTGSKNPYTQDGLRLGTEAAWLKRMVIREIRACDVANDAVGELHREIDIRRARQARGPQVSCKPAFVRFRDEDRLLRDARAVARGMRPATCVSALTRLHLRFLTPLPKEEYLALKAQALLFGVPCIWRPPE